MYNFLDRPITALDEPHRFLLAAMRVWVESARGGRCPCSALAGAFARCGMPTAIRDFGMAMATLDRDGAATLHFGVRGRATVQTDEARVLALFSAAMGHETERTRRIAATLVSDEATPRLAAAAEWVALQLGDATFVERYS